MTAKDEWRKAFEALEGIRPYEDGYNKETVHRLIDEGDKLQADINSCELALRTVEEERNKFISCRDLLGCDIGAPEGMKYAMQNNLFLDLCPKLVSDAAEILEAIL